MSDIPPTVGIFMDSRMPDERFPSYQSDGAAGFDLCAYIPGGTAVTFKPGEACTFRTGLSFILPKDYELQIRSRSGMATRRGLVVINQPGTIDSDYRGEVIITLLNQAPFSAEIIDGDRIAQAIVSHAPQHPLLRVSTIKFDTERGGNGFGSTGR